MKTHLSELVINVKHNSLKTRFLFVPALHSEYITQKKSACGGLLKFNLFLGFDP